MARWNDEMLDELADAVSVLVQTFVAEHEENRQFRLQYERDREITEQRYKEYLEWKREIDQRFNNLLEEVRAGNYGADQRIAALRSEFLGVKPSSLPPLRPLEVGDLVQVRESGSPYYLEKFTITRVGMIRAYVETREGECSFLKRDLRLIINQPDLP